MSKIYKKNGMGYYIRNIYSSLIFYIILTFLCFAFTCFIHLLFSKVEINIIYLKIFYLSMLCINFILISIFFTCRMFEILKYASYTFYRDAKKLEKSIKNNLIDSLVLNRKITTPRIEVPDVNVFFLNNSIKVVIERLPGMDNIENLILLVGNAFKGKYINYSVVDYSINLNINEYFFILEDVNISKRLVPRHISDFSTNSQYKLRIQNGLLWDMNKCPHCIVSGKTGSGKSTFLLSLILQYFNNGSELYIIDPKREFANLQFFFSNVFYDKESILELMNKFLLILKDREDEVKNRTSEIGSLGVTACDLGLKPIILMVDELSSFVSSLDSKERKIFENVFLQLIQKGRSLGIIVIAAMQNANSEFLKVAIRNQFSFRILLGNSSKEDIQFIFGSNNETISFIPDQFSGFYYLDGFTSNPRKIEIPDIYKYNLYNIAFIKSIYQKSFFN